MFEGAEEIKRRCREAGIEFEEYDEEGIEQVGYGLFVFIPRGRNRRGRTLNVDEFNINVNEFLSLPFEKYRLIEGYEASWSSEDKVIECNLLGLSTHNYRPSAAGVLSRLGLKLTDANPDFTKRVEIDSPTNLSISIGPSSDIHGFLQYVDIEGPNDIPIEWDKPLVIRIADASVETHEEAVELLRRVADTSLFQLNLTHGLSLAPERQINREARWADYWANSFFLYEEFSDSSVNVSTVKLEYDTNAMSLYWNAKMASQMPLLQFLSYYQVLEYFYPVYSEQEARTTVQNVLKDPAFDPTRDADVSKLLAAVKVGARGRTFGNEAEQLEATIRHCVSADDLRAFLISENEGRYKFYTSDKARKLVDEKLPVKQESDDHRNAVAKRVYALRNRIVHTKSGGDYREPLFPFDPETKYIHHDIELVEFLARKVLIASGRPLQA